MILSVLRSIGSVVAGLVAAFIVVVAMEVFGEIFHPFPPGENPNDMEACKAHVARFPTWVLATGAVGWAAGVLIAAWLATRLGTGRKLAHGIVVGAILLALAGLNISMLPYAIWFPIAILVSFPIAALWGAKLGRGKMAKAVA